MQRQQHQEWEREEVGLSGQARAMKDTDLIVREGGQIELRYIDL